MKIGHMIGTGNDKITALDTIVLCKKSFLINKGLYLLLYSAWYMVPLVYCVHEFY